MEGTIKRTNKFKIYKFKKTWRKKWSNDESDSESD
jgi:hypothetical protein